MDVDVLAFHGRPCKEILRSRLHLPHPHPTPRLLHMYQRFHSTSTIPINLDDNVLQLCQHLSAAAPMLSTAHTCAPPIMPAIALQSVGGVFRATLGFMALGNGIKKAHQPPGSLIGRVCPTDLPKRQKLPAS